MENKNLILRLVDYSGNTEFAELGDLNDIAVITIRVVTGDEIAVVIYKDYTTDEFDSSHDRCQDYYDGEYEIYRFDKPAEDQLLFNEKWKERTNSYDWLYGSDED